MFMTSAKIPNILRFSRHVVTLIVTKDL